LSEKLGTGSRKLEKVAEGGVRSTRGRAVFMAVEKAKLGRGDRTTEVIKVD